MIQASQASPAPCLLVGASAHIVLCMRAHKPALLRFCTCAQEARAKRSLAGKLAEAQARAEELSGHWRVSDLALNNEVRLPMQQLCWQARSLAPKRSG